MNLREKFIWNLSLAIATIVLILSIYNFFQIGKNANEYYDKFKSEEVGTDKELEKKVSDLENNYKFRDNLVFNISSDPADLNRVVSVEGSSRGKKRKSLWVSGIINRGNNNNIAIMNYKDQSFNVVKGDSVAGGVIEDITPTEVIFNKNDKIIKYNLSIQNTLD
ncbi:MAG: hypothetical protein CMG14_01900 [Candidatus Marinimicrobia bacterium]|nr:hypothetical protein [Candidatus Neomarinimicrobiota bacterium]